MMLTWLHITKEKYILKSKESLKPKKNKIILFEEIKNNCIVR